LKSLNVTFDSMSGLVYVYKEVDTISLEWNWSVLVVSNVRFTLHSFCFILDQLHYKRAEWIWDM